MRRLVITCTGAVLCGGVTIFATQSQPVGRAFALTLVATALGVFVGAFIGVVLDEYRPVRRAWWRPEKPVARARRERYSRRLP